MKKPEYKHTVQSEALINGCDKSFERDMAWLDGLLKDTKIMITDSNGNTFLIDHGDIKPVDRFEKTGL